MKGGIPDEHFWASTYQQGTSYFSTCQNWFKNKGNSREIHNACRSAILETFLDNFRISPLDRDTRRLWVFAGRSIRKCRNSSTFSKFTCAGSQLAADETLHLFIPKASLIHAAARNNTPGLHSHAVAMHTSTSTAGICRVLVKQHKVVCVWRGDENNSDSSNVERWGDTWTTLQGLETCVLC